MEEKETTGYTKDEREKTRTTFILPPHNNLMVWAILITLLCCLVGGIIAIVYSANSNSAYRNALITQDEALKQTLYYESEKENKTAKTWIFISIGVGLAGYIAYILLISFGVFAAFNL